MSMSRRAMSFLAVMLFLVPASLAAEPGDRTGDLDATRTVNDVVVSGDGSIIVVGAQGATSGLGPSGNVDTWSLWDAAVASASSAFIRDGAPVRSCSAIANCRGNTVGVAIDDSGDRIVVVSNYQAGGGDETAKRSQIQFIKPLDGGVAFFELNTTLIDVVMSDDGRDIAVLGRTVPGGITPPKTAVYKFQWTGGGQSTAFQVFQAFIDGPDDFTTDPVEIGISGDGDRIVVASGDYFRFTTSATPVARVNLGGAQATSVSIGDAAPHWTLVGFEAGEVALFSDSAPGTPEFSPPGPVGNPDIVATSVSDDGSRYAFADEDGDIHLWEVFATTPSLNDRITTVDAFNAAPSAIELSGDGQLLSITVATTVQMWQVNPDNAAALWVYPSQGDAALTGPASALGTSTDQDFLAVGHGSVVKRFDAIHSVATSAPTLKVVQPSGDTKFTFTMTNTGNRQEVATPAVDFPPGWFAATATTQVVLEANAPGRSQQVEVSVIVPEFAPPGDYKIRLNHTLAGGQTGTASATVRVPTIHELSLVPDGPASKAAQPGAPTPFSVFVRNDGNVAETVRLSVSVTEGDWTATLAPAEVTVAPDSQQAVTVNVEAPSDAAELERVVLTVSAVGNPALKTTLSATVGARYGVQLSAPSGTEVWPGNSTRFEVAVTNTGNTLDSFVITLDTSTLPPGWVGRFGNGLGQFTIRDVKKGMAVNVPIVLDAPVNAEIGKQHAFSVVATSDADAAQNHARSMFVSVAAPPLRPDPTETNNDTPGVPFVLLGAALLGAAIALRRRGAAP